MNRMQRHNKFVDSLKDMWCERHGYPLLRIWEYDIRHNPKAVMDMISEYLTEGQRKRRIDELKRRPH